ncbi:MAG: hypothetical protein F6K19_43015, partial [Cyanothece sp. SIO1E1]|nr:hypothetical protein [Cyanothece sp. SIO1E1]
MRFLRSYAHRTVVRSTGPHPDTTHSLPNRTDQAIDLPYELPHLLTEAGVQVSLSHTGMLA